MNCIIVDDEPVARKGMKSLIEQVSQLELAGSFNSGIAASAFMNEHTVDLIFLDIQMPGITGIEFAQSIPENTLVIFTTAYAEYALDSYEVNAVDYLIKPIELNRFLIAVNKAVAYHKRQNLKRWRISGKTISLLNQNGGFSKLISAASFLLKD